MRRLATLSLVAVLVASACSSDQNTTASAPTARTESESTASETTISDAVEEASTEADTADSTSAESPESADEAERTTDPAPMADNTVTEADLSLFIAAAERALEGTAQEAAIFDDPEIYIALAQASCDRFSDGETFEQIATDLLADLDTTDATDETRLVGAILGAATQTLCPEHADKI